MQAREVCPSVNVLTCWTLASSVIERLPPTSATVVRPLHPRVGTTLLAFQNFAPHHTNQVFDSQQGLWGLV